MFPISFNVQSQREGRGIASIVAAITAPPTNIAIICGARALRVLGYSEARLQPVIIARARLSRARIDMMTTAITWTANQPEGGLGELLMDIFADLADIDLEERPRRFDRQYYVFSMQ